MDGQRHIGGDARGAHRVGSTGGEFFCQSRRCAPPGNSACIASSQRPYRLGPGTRAPLRSRWPRTCTRAAYKDIGIPSRV